MILALIGLSQNAEKMAAVHRSLLNAEVRPVDLKREELEEFLKKREFDGLYVSGPFQRAVMPYLDECDACAVKTGNVSTVINRNGKLIGYNTDPTALSTLFLETDVDLAGKKTAVLGDGFAAENAAEAVRQLNGIPVPVSEEPSDQNTLTYEELYKTQAEYVCLINTTATGAYPREEEMPVDLSRFDHLEAAADLIADPLRTRLILEAGYRGMKTLSGSEILFHQAVAADAVFLNGRLDPVLIETCRNELNRPYRNIVIIGMPTSGKSTFSRMLGDRTGRRIVEMDHEAEKLLGTTIAECFATKGEPYFRNLETEIARAHSAPKGEIISCGGGVIKTPETMRLLSHNGLIVWLRRDLDRLYPSGNRPLSSNLNDLNRLYEERLPLYTKYADCAVDNNGAMADTFRRLLRTIHEDVNRTAAGAFNAVVSSSGDKHAVSVAVPPSKSISHRALISASMAAGTSVIQNIANSQDISATKNAMAVLGARYEENGTDLLVHGIGGKIPDTAMEIDCGESATTLRFLIPLFAANDQETIFHGRGRLLQRPLDVYEEIFRAQGLLFEKEAGIVRVQGPLQPGVFTVDRNISSQFISGLLFALPLKEGDSEIHIRPPFESSPYIDLTLEALKHAGIQIERDGLNFYIQGSQNYKAHSYAVDGDDSQAAVYAALAYLNQLPIEVTNMAHDSLQADHAVISIMKQFGGIAEETKTGYVFKPSALKPASISLAECPDLGPILFALASQIEGTTEFTDCARLRIKESDRIAAMEEELKKLGVKITSSKNSVTIEGRASIQGGVAVNSHHDHRIVMALAVLAACTEKPLVIEDAEAVRKSWPDFFEDIRKAGMRAETKRPEYTEKGEPPRLKASPYRRGFNDTCGVKDFRLHFDTVNTQYGKE